MIKAVSQRISRWLVANGAREREDVLAYGAECFINEAISTVLLLIIGIGTNRVWELLIWSVSFCLLRVHLGGIHAPTHALCLWGGTLVGASSLLVSPLLLRNVWISAALLLAAALMSGILAPVPHKNKQHVQKNRESIKKKVIVIAALECVAVFAVFPLAPVMASYAASGLLMAAALGLAGFWWNPR